MGQLLSTSELALTEIWSALMAKERNKAHSAQEHRAAAWRVFNERVQGKQIVLHPLNSVVLKKANQILARCHPAVPLRTLDAIHTAPAISARIFLFARPTGGCATPRHCWKSPSFPEADPST